MQAKRIGDYLDRGDGTSRLVPQVALLLAMRQHLSQALPDNAVAAKLRHYEPKIIEILGKRGLKATGMRVEVQGARSFAPQMPEKKALFLAPSAAEALARLARRLPDSRLKQAVNALSRKTR